MTAERVLWTGPYGAGLRDRALASASTDPSTLWMVATPLARDQVRRELALASPGPAAAPRVWCWTELWQVARGELEDGPACLSDEAAGAVFAEALREARQAGELKAIAEAIDWPGHRRRLRARLAEWTTLERSPGAAAPREAVAAAEWAVFVRYRRLLRSCGAQDELGFAVWASKRLRAGPPASLRAPDQVTFLDWEDPTRAQWRVLELALRQARSVRVTLAYEDDAESALLYEATVPVRCRLRELHFDQVALPAEADRPAGLRELERRLFRADRPAKAGGIALVRGFCIRGAPEGEGVARLLAREVRALLDRGTDPQEVLVVFRQWNEQADVALEVFQEWGLPVSAEPRRPIAADPAVAALLTAITLPIEDWAADQLIRLLRNRRLRPTWPGADPLSLAAAARAVQATRVFRGRAPLWRALGRVIAEGTGGPLAAGRAQRARDLLGALFGALEGLDRSRTYTEQVEQLKGVVHELGLGDSDTAGLDQLALALEDRGDVQARLGQGASPWSWPAFVGEVESLVLEPRAPGVPGRPGSVRIATVDQIHGARAGFVILADMAEGTFPAREAVEGFLLLRPGQQPGAATRAAFSREMLRFLRVLGSARLGVTLVYPTTDQKGQDVLRAGFLDELMELVDADAASGAHVAVRRLDPALLDRPDLAGSPGDQRIRALALARAHNNPSMLSALAALPAHRAALEGTAAALQMLGRRGRGSRFSEYDGLLEDGHAVLNIVESFGPDSAFSASQLETYIGCPFRFYCNYVLKLEPDDRRDELDEDFTERGARIHHILEQLERMKQVHEGQQSFEDLARVTVENELGVARSDESDIDRGLLEIERRRLLQTITRYEAQWRDYLDDPGGRPVPHLFEVEFGTEQSRHRHLELGQGSRLVRLQGKIDRIDLVEGSQRRGFRVIDYKSGAGPSESDVRKARLLQLPLYAMAVERIILADEAVMLRDLGYWALRKEGYKPITFDDWAMAQELLEAYVLALVERLRRGVFIVDSQIDHCEDYCDFRAICRIRQARAAEKRPDRPVPPELPKRLGGSGRTRRPPAASPPR
jgi:RecB family exonuclease